MKVINLIKALKGHTSGWVSISNDNKRIIASGKTLKELLNKLERLGKPRGYLMKATKDYSGYVGV